MLLVSLTNIYNLLPASSGLRPQTLTSLFQLLTSNSTLELSYFPLTKSWLTSALSQWEISASDKISWLSSTAEIFETKGSKKGDKEKGLELRIFALRTAVQDGNDEESKKLTQKALRALFAIPSKFDIEEVLNVKSAREGLSGQYKELVELFENGELEQGLSWVQKNESFLSGECESHREYCSNFPFEKAKMLPITYTALKRDQIARKLRLLALTSLAASSSTKEITYGDIAKTLKLDEDDIEISVIDGQYNDIICS